MKLQAILYLTLVSTSAVEAASRQHPVSTSSTRNEYLSQRTALLDEMMIASKRQRQQTQKEGDRIKDVIQAFDPQNEQNGLAAFKFLTLLASSPLFVSEFWQTKPLLLRSSEMIEIAQNSCDTNDIDNNSDDAKVKVNGLTHTHTHTHTHNWVDGSFTIERDLKLIDGSYISGSRTDDILRSGIKTDSWAFRPIKDDPARRTTWEEVDDALQGGTIYFNSAGSFWPTLGALCRLTNYAFGLPTNINIYITPPGAVVSVPPHTDRQDVLVFQTEGSKRWRVYGPPKRIKGKDPLNRGKGGDVIEKKELGNPILDVVLRRGDVMYVPAGFPHTTDTTTIVEQETVPSMSSSMATPGQKLFDETSVHLTLGLDTHVWALTYAHVRWTLLQRCGKDWRLDITKDTDYWDSMRTIAVGFLSGSESGLGSVNDNDNNDNTMDMNAAVEETKRVLMQLEPKRWTKEALPSDDEIRAVFNYMTNDHLASLLEIQETMYSDINPHDENTIIKGYHMTQKQDAIMQRYGAFSNNDAMEKSFEKRRLDREQKTNSAGGL